MNKLIQSLSAIGVSATLVTPNLNAEATTNSEPQLRGVNDIIIEKGEDYNLLQGISAYDKEDGDLTHKIKISLSINIFSLIKFLFLQKFLTVDKDCRT